MWRKIIVMSCVGLMATSAFSQSMSKKVRRMERLLGDIERSVQQLEYGHVSRPEKRAAIEKIIRLQRVAQRLKHDIAPRRHPKQLPGLELPSNGGPGPGPYPPNPGYPPVNPGPGYGGLVADCHIDNDTTFTWGENVVGTFRAETVDQLLTQCKEMAQITYGSWSSFGIKNLQSQGYVGPNKIMAQCHIDNDTTLTLNETVIGQVVGNSVSEVMNSCQKIAQLIYGSWSSFGILGLTQSSQGYGQMSATCHIDNDTTLTYGEYVVGKVVGNSPQDLARQCSSIAQKIFGSWSSSGIQDLGH